MEMSEEELLKERQKCAVPEVAGAGVEMENT